MYEKPNFENTEIISVNYNTPELIDSLLKSIRNFYQQKPDIRIIDGSDNEKSRSDIVNIINKYKNIKMDVFGYNIHHGPGMHYGIKTTKHKYVWIPDSDCFILKNGVLEEYFNMWEDGLYGMGSFCYVDKHGINPKKDAEKYQPSHPYLYAHPNAIFINKEMYFKFHPFIKHGAPLIATMIDIHNRNLSNKILKDSRKINKEYLSMGGRGTVNKFGYNLNN